MLSREPFFDASTGLPTLRISRSSHSAQVTTFSETKQGVPVDDAVFKMPVPKP